MPHILNKQNQKNLRACHIALMYVKPCGKFTV